jgi:hypothetical protein
MCIGVCKCACRQQRTHQIVTLKIHSVSASTTTNTYSTCANPFALVLHHRAKNHSAASRSRFLQMFTLSCCEHAKCYRSAKSDSPHENDCVLVLAEPHVGACALHRTPRA